MAPEEFIAALPEWLWELRACRGEGARPLVAIDRPALRGTQRGRSGGAVLPVLTARATEAGLLLAQVGFEPDTNDTAVAPHLINLLALKAVTVTIDAAGSHAHIARGLWRRGTTCRR